MMKHILCILLIAAAFAAGRISSPGIKPERIVETIVRTDTVRITRPEIVVVRAQTSRKETLPLQPDTVHGDDSVVVEVDYAQKVYESERYRAYVSGHNPSLDSIEIFQPVRIRNISEPKRVSIGLQGGYGLTPRGFQPYIGIGVTIRIF